MIVPPIAKIGNTLTKTRL